jgi:hypothetical protein
MDNRNESRTPNGSNSKSYNLMFQQQQQQQPIIYQESEIIRNATTNV